MASLTTNYGWTKPVVGGDTDAWGGELNADLDGIDSTVYSIQTSIPAASSTSPVMDGTAATGISTAWSRGDHVHPTDTSRYAASNPSGYQTAAQVTTSLGGYLPLAGGTMTGPANLIGVTNASNAAAGQVGEVISSNYNTGFSLTSGTAASLTSIALTAGDWEVSGEVWINIGTGGATQIGAAINNTVNSIPSASALNVARTVLQVTVAASGTVSLSLRPCWINISAGATYYLTCYAAFPSGSCIGLGNIHARRMR